MQYCEMHFYVKQPNLIQCTYLSSVSIIGPDTNLIQRTYLSSVFIIGPDTKIKLIITYPASCGRNFDEVI
jgi:hypothetical protein